MSNITAARRVVSKFLPYGPRGYAMLSLALVAIFRAVDYLKPAQPGYTPSALRELAQIIPTPVWGALWAVTGAWVLFSAFREKQAVALGLLAGMSFLWATMYVATAVLRGDSPDAVAAWLAALGFVAFAVIVVALSKMINPAKIREVPDA
jgi:hypothetical protein